MIKIIKEGKKPIKTKRVYKTTCSECGCEYEFEEEDCISFIRYKGFDYRAPLITVKCPYCGCSITATEDAVIFTYEDRIADEKPYDIMTDNDTWKIHPEQDLVYRPYGLDQLEKQADKIKNKAYGVIYTDHINNDDLKYYNVHTDGYDITKNIDFSPWTNLPDDIDNTISRINSIDNYKLPDDYPLPKGYKLVRDCSKCPLGPCFGGSDLLKADGDYTNCKLEADLEIYNTAYGNRSVGTPLNPDGSICEAHGAIINEK